MAGADTCASCGDTIVLREGDTDRVLILSGVLYCARCIKDVAFDCHRCHRALHLQDFEKGHAMVLLGKKYCDQCLEKAVEKRRKGDASDSSAPKVSESSTHKWEAHRAHRRIVPPAECVLTMTRSGMRGFFGGNLVRLWVDVSEGGLRAITEGNYSVEDRLKGTLSYAPMKLKLEFEGTVRYSKPSTQFPKCMVVGLRFESPSPELQTFIHNAVAEQRSHPRNKPPTTKVSA